MKDYITSKGWRKGVAWLTLLGLWTLLSFLVNNPVIVPGIPTTLLKLADIVQSQGFLTIIGFTVFRCLTGFILSVLMAIVAGTLCKAFSFARALMEPVLGFLSSVPIMAIILLALIWLDSQLVPIFVSFVMVFPILYDTVYAAILQVDDKLLQMAKVYGISRRTMARDIYLPAILFGLGKVSASTLGNSLKMVIAGEVLAQPKFAIGTRLLMEKTYLNTDGVFAWIIVILLLSYLLRLLMAGIKALGANEEWR